MKPYTYSLLAALFACGMAQGAATAYTTPVGYETLPVTTGFNYLGLRLHESATVSGKLEAVSSGSVTDNDVDLGAALVDTTTYILEIDNVNGVTQEFLGSAATGGVLTTPADLSSFAAAGDSYTIRPAATLSSVFGATNSAGLATGFFGPGSDLIFVPTGSGFDQYYYDAGEVSWARVDGASYVTVNGSTVPLIYSDGVIISAGGPLSLVVDGEVKTGKTLNVLSANSFNYLSSVYPVGATLASAFGGATASMDKGFFGPGADLIYSPDGAGGFNQYYYDDGEVSWAVVQGAGYMTIDATTVNLSSGVIVFNGGAAANLVNSPPSFYSSL